MWFCIVLISRQDWLEKVAKKQAANFLFKFLSWDQFIPLHLARDKLNKKSATCLSLSIPCLFGAEKKVIQNHIARFSKI